MHLKIATFNCENLFSRPILLNSDNEKEASATLAKVAELQGLIAKAQYSPQDKDRMAELLTMLDPFIEVTALRSALFIDNEDGTKRIVAKGRGSFAGNIELKRDVFPRDQQLNTAEIIKTADADIQLLVEVESRRVLEELDKVALGGRYPFNMLVDGNDDRGIDVAILSKFEILSVQTHIFDKGGTVKGDRVFNRDCLEVTVKLPDGRKLVALVNHLKSKRSVSGQDEGAPLRKIQADHIAEKILSKYKLTEDLVVVGGDLNAVPGEEPLAKLLGVAHLFNVADAISDPSNRWTYHHRQFGNSQFDYLLVSKPLKDALKKVALDRRGIFGITPTDAEGNEVAPLPDLKKANQASDHALVSATFELP